MGIRQIYWHDANYPDEKDWLSKSDIINLINRICKKEQRNVEQLRHCFKSVNENMEVAINNFAIELKRKIK